MGELTVGSVFSGIDGLGLGLENAGMAIKWNCEIEPYCRRVLAKRWPHVPNLGDIKTIDWSTVEHVDLVAGGFPCPDISNAHTNGARLGLFGGKSGLWWEFSDAIGELAPTWVIIENVAAWRRWVPGVRCDLFDRGYASLPLELSASQFGLPHHRPRVFVVAHADGQSEPLRAIHAEASRLRPLPRRDGWPALASAVGSDDGVPHRVDRLRALGNAVVPAVAEWIGRRILEVAA